jgi:hypothetical protein
MVWYNLEYIYSNVRFCCRRVLSVHGMNTRQQNKLHVPSVRLSSIQRDVYYPSAKIFNQVPQNIYKYCNNIHTFKIL